MTPAELETLRLNLRVQACQIVIESLANALAPLPLASRLSLLEKAKRMQQQCVTQTFPHLPPEQSDLYSAEFEEAMREALKLLEVRLLPPPHA